MGEIKNPEILIIDLSSQLAAVIERTIRETGHRSAIFGPKGAKKWLEKNKPKGIFLSGGQQSVYDEDALMPPDEILEMGIPIFGICYGMQWMAYKMGGRVVPNIGTKDISNKNYGETSVYFESSDRIFKDISHKEHKVWASHGDSVQSVPSGFREIGWTNKGRTIMAMHDSGRGYYAVQFHPEAPETAIGKEILRRFVEDVCGCEKDWSAENFIGQKRDEIAYVMKGKKAVLAYSGGVDSSVTLGIAHPVLGERLGTFCIDTGALREGELHEIVSNAREIGISNLRVLFRSREFFSAVGNSIDAEEKRKGFQSIYGPLLDHEGKAFGAKFVFQGTNKADRVESGKAGRSGHIKSHHNEVEIELIKYNPLQDLFKYEIRALAYKLGLSEEIAERMPFPGPGIFLRVNGILVTPDKVEIVRWADKMTMQMFKKHNIYKEISQCPVSLNGVPTVGVSGDGRVYKYSIVIHPVQTIDFMTSRGFQVPAHIRREVTRELTKHHEIVRVYWDEGDKPKASTEPE
ncbi:MAG: glutamine-hydrolyzing GMP synthase [Parcubacteria group bacterium]|jgi:GMP synthase (glutamine-hydrolysing)